MLKSLQLCICPGILLGKRKEDHQHTISEVIDKIGCGWAQVRVTMTCGAVWLADGAELLLITAAATSVADEWKLGEYTKSSMITIVFAGVCLGNFFGGSLGDFYGRRFPIMVSFMGIVIFSIASSYTNSYFALSFARFVVGAAFGIGQPAETALIAETTPTEWRICFMAVTMILFSLGEAYSAMLIWVDDPTMEKLDWRWLMRMGAIPSAVFGVLAWFLAYESPYYLSVMGQHEAATEVLKKIRHANGVSPSLVSVECAPAKAVTPTLKNTMSVVFGPETWWVTLVMAYSAFLLNSLFYGCLYAFSQILPEMEKNSRVSPSASLMVGALMEIPGFIIGTFLGTTLSRKTATAAYLVLTTFSLVIFATTPVGTSGGTSTPETEATQQWYLSLAYYGIKMWPSIGFIVVYVMAAEQYPSSARVTGTAICIAAGRFGAMTGSVIYEAIEHLTGSYNHFFIALAIGCVINLVLIQLLSDTTGSHMDSKDGLVTSAELEKGNAPSVSPRTPKKPPVPVPVGGALAAARALEEKKQGTYGSLQ
jgi:putative MFS transporter